jgi:transcription-repair coupling factor (superfamily II helicase)
MLDLYSHHHSFNKALDSVKEIESQNTFIKGLSGSSQAFFIASVFQKSEKSMVCILPEKEEAANFYSDIFSLLNEQYVHFFPSSFRKKHNINDINTANSVIRTGVLEKISSANNKLLIVTYPEAIAEKVISNEILTENTLILHKGEKVSSSFIEEVLVSYDFERTDFVYKPGQYAFRGSIIDIFSFSSENPFRIDFIGDEVNNIRSFNIENQLSIKEFEKFAIVPDFSQKCGIATNSSMLSFYKIEPIIYLKDSGLFEKQIEQFNIDSSELFNTATDLIDLITKYNILETGVSCIKNHNQILQFSTSSQPSFNKNFDLLGSDLIDRKSKEYKVYILSDNPHQIERLNAIFDDMGIPGLFETKSLNIHEGFIDNDLQVCCYTDHQIFGKYHKYKLRDDFLKSETITLNEFYNLHPGDYVVHIDHGIGVFGGLEKVNLNGKWQEQIRLVYKDKDILFVNLHSLHKISKYKSKDGDVPKLNKLGTGAWTRLKQNTKNKVKDIARDLIDLYAKRLQQKGFAFSPDTYLQTELEASFIYEDTPDQEKATNALKADMELDIPMDRLICGDVGFGKTEVAIRAAFKAVTDSKQVAVLVPTTILALQHYYTFTDRLKDFPCKIEFLSRFKTAAEQKEIFKEIASGKIDIVIGTHKLLNKELHFKDLGLFIIDEEQKFGVAAKEKLRSIRVDVDTLTLTATPIPRTLQFSLMGARDLSIINTPPPNRQPVVTEVHIFNEELIRDAINYELNRNGQVFFVHNHVQNIQEVELLIKKLCPHARTAVGHGQMKPADLEKLMLNFINGKNDVLISTTIVENGLDIPNANTIIINNGHMFGLSDLHQLRGRVGRSNRKAFCYIMAPSIDTLPTDSKRRLRAIEEFSELGSGFNIALQDLDIRGAGNLLGGEQSGFIADIGFDAYQKILQEAMLELHESEFQNITPAPKKADLSSINKEYSHDCVVETDMELFIPEKYVENMSEKIKLYRELDNIDNEKQLQLFSDSLADRFGKLPKEVLGLFDVLRLRWKAKQLGFEKMILKQNRFICYFINDKSSPYYSSQVFSNILQYLHTSKSSSGLKEINDKLSLNFDKVSSIEKANQLLEGLIQNVINVSSM